MNDVAGGRDHQVSRLVRTALWIPVGVLAYFIVSSGSTIWLNHSVDKAVEVSILIVVVSVGCLVLLSWFMPRAGITVGVSILVLAIIAYLCGGFGAEAMGSTVLDLQRLFLHGGRSPIVFEAGIAVLLVAALRVRDPR